MTKSAGWCNHAGGSSGIKRNASGAIQRNRRQVHAFSHDLMISFRHLGVTGLLGTIAGKSARLHTLTLCGNLAVLNERLASPVLISIGRDTHVSTSKVDVCLDLLNTSCVVTDFSPAEIKDFGAIFA